ncbi:MAG: hypothetical protein GXP53_06175 [Deltaproteobacteria bacterium]|nr:hypothetical protein [Deltaproteobacteria bacterium]
MVKGLELFREYFKDHIDKYILIGGVACDILLSGMDLPFRVTKDLDIVLIIESIDAQFGILFWDFVKAGQYKNRQKSTGKALFYRFYAPQNDAYPFMLELFARQPDVLNLPEGSHLTPIPIDEDASSLSAILIDDDYYNFILQGKQITEDTPIVSQEYLIVLKAKAYMDLSRRQGSGEDIDNKDIRKHKNDLFRLYQILSPDSTLELPVPIADDMRRFLDRIIEDPPNLKDLDIRNTTIDNVLKNLKMIYNL